MLMNNNLGKRHVSGGEARYANHAVHPDTLTPFCKQFNHVYKEDEVCPLVVSNRLCKFCRRKLEILERYLKTIE